MRIVTFLILSLFCATACVFTYSDYKDGENSFPEMDEVVALLNKFGTLSSATADIGAYMNKLSHQSHALMKVTLPVGTLMAGSLRIASETESRKYLALRELTNKMDELYKKMEKSITFATSVIALEIKMHDYINKVHLPAVHIHDQLELFWNPSFNKTQNQMEDFKQSCYYAFPRSETPLGILNFIYEHTVKRCSEGLTTETTKLLANFQNLLRQIKERLGISHHQQFDTETEELAVRFASLDTEIANEVLAKMECQAISAQNPLEEIKNIFSGYMDDDLPNSLCLLQDIIVGKNFNNKAVEELENIIRLDLLQQVFFGGICANITFGGNVDEMEWYQTKIIGLVKHMLNFIPNYLERELAKSFPYIEMNAVRVAIDQLGLTCPVTTIGEMFQVKDKVFTHLAQVGSKRFVRQGFVVQNLKFWNDFYAICPEESCFYISDHKSVNVMITRYNQKDEERAQDARKWFERKIEYKSKMISFNNYLYRKLDENFNLDNVSDLVGIIENEMETLLCTPQTYRNMAVLRDYDAQMRCRVKEAAQLSVISELMLGYDYVPYRFDGTFFLKCEEWKLYFFL